MSNHIEDRELLRQNIRLMMQLDKMAVPTLEIHECINQLEDTLIKRKATLEQQGKDNDTDAATLFYLKVMRCLWIASYAEEKMARMHIRAEKEASKAIMYQRMYEETDKELRKYEVIADLISEDELANYIKKTQQALSFKRTESNPLPTTNKQ